MVAFWRVDAAHPPTSRPGHAPVSAPADPAGQDLAFRDLFAPELWRRLVALGEPVEIPAGSVLLHRGEPSDALYAIEEGAVEVIDGRSSPETVLDVLGPGHALGDMAFMDQGPAAADVRARVHSTAVRWGREALETQLDADPELASAFFRALSRSLVGRMRVVLSAAVVGGFGVAAPPPRDRGDPLDLDRVAYGLAVDLLDPLAYAGSAEEEHRADQLSAALTATCRWFTVAGEAARAAGVGDRLHALLAEVLSSSATTSAMLARADGSLAGPELFRHVLGGAPSGLDPAGLLFDRALLKLPTFRGWRWRDAAMAEVLDEALPSRAARVLSVSLTGAPISQPQLSVLRGRGGHVTSVLLARRIETGNSPPEITRSTVMADLPSLLRGAGPQVGARHHAVVVDRVTDVVPDEVLRALLGWARKQLTPDGVLVVGHAVPADDTTLLDHLLRWPSLPRRAPSVIALLPRAGAHRVLTPHDDEAGGLITWRQA